MKRQALFLIREKVIDCILTIYPRKVAKWILCRKKEGVPLCYSHTQPGHEPDLMQVKMGENCPRIDGNLHTVRVETARYGFCIRI
jgi:hypothetical protein